MSRISPDCLNKASARFRSPSTQYKSMQSSAASASLPLWYPLVSPFHRARNFAPDREDDALSMISRSRRRGYSLGGAGGVRDDGVDTGGGVMAA